ncbi:hypothetical protein cbdbA713 [Dehalococcoides mccartyi CBDB1]|uniref:Uncharacterized protein n=1 Tax=Dehalococcoides mccartyi (strain CBDB1) TaxID=255470 RepID=A0A916NZ67_DEHMC|nr:hypothetical protein cbdbA713 [Dehalococcoides mccartyi CBDB1]
MFPLVLEYKTFLMNIQHAIPLDILPTGLLGLVASEAESV